MAIDQRDVSSKLRFMDDGALQQYAAMHKNDPYIFPLAFQESQNRQRLRMQQQAQAGAQPQPKVADQALAQMAPQQAQPMPEDVGIGALPAPNMTMAAEGGIMGYEGYDEGPSDFGQEPVLRMAGGGVARYQVGGSTFAQMDQQKADQISQLNGQLAIIEPQLRAAAASGDQQAIQLYSQQAQGIRNQINAVREATGNRVSVIDKLAAQSQPTALTPEVNRSAINQTEQGARKDPTTYGTPVPAKPKPDTGRPAPTRAATDPSAKPETGGLDSLMAEYERKQSLARNTARNAAVQYASSLRGEGAKLVADEENRIKDQVDPYKERETRLLKQEKGLEGMGDKYLGLALLQAGAAMMTTPGGIGMALGKGVQVGSERYIQGIEKINAAKDKFADARDRLDDLRLNRSDMNARDIKAAKTEARTLERQAEALFYTGAREDLNMTDKNLTTLLGLAADNIKTDKTLKAERENVMIREGGANARAAMPTGTDRTAMMLGTGKTDAERLESGMKKMQEITADKSGMAAVKLLTEANAKLLPGEPRLTMEDLLKSAREYSSLMYGPKVADVAPTRERPR